MAGKFPSNWALTTLGEVFQWGSGGTPKANEPRYYGGEIPWLNIGDLTDSLVYESEKKITKAGLRESAARYVEPGNVLVAMYGSIGKLAVAGTRLATNQAIAFTKRIPEGVESKYLFWFLTHAKPDLVEAGKGGTQRNISQTVLKGIRFPLAPSEEQKRIVAKIEELFSELDKGVESLKTARAQLQTYRQSLLKAAFEGRLTEQWHRENADRLETADQLLDRIREEREARYRQQLDDWKMAVAAWEAEGKSGRKPSKPKALKFDGSSLSFAPKSASGWEEHCAWMFLGDIAEVSGGITKNQSRSLLSLQRPFLRVANVYANELRLEDIHQIGVDESELDKVELSEGDLLIVEGNGSVDQLGRVAVWDGSVSGAVHQNHLIRARPVSRVVPKYVMWFLLSHVGRELIKKVASSTSGLHTLSLSKVSKLRIPLCDHREQMQIVDYIEEEMAHVERMEETISASMGKAAALRQSILKRAFEGRLVPQDPDDEPASILLERIRAEREAGSKPAGLRGRRTEATA